MSDEWAFEKVGAYWKHPLYKKLWINFTSWFRGTWMFLRCLTNYQESIVENEMTIEGAWSLCHSLQEARVGKTLRMVQSPNNSRKGGDDAPSPKSVLTNNSSMEDKGNAKRN